MKAVKSQDGVWQVRNTWYMLSYGNNHHYCFPLSLNTVLCRWPALLTPGDDWNRTWLFRGDGQPECTTVPFGLWRPHCWPVEGGIQLAEWTSRAAQSTPSLPLCSSDWACRLPPLSRMEITLLTCLSQGCCEDVMN